MQFMPNVFFVSVLELKKNISWNWGPVRDEILVQGMRLEIDKR